MSSGHENFSPVLDLQLRPKQGMTQRLIMSSHMQQAINLLQIPLLGLEPFIEEQIAQNPVLEIIDDSNDLDVGVFEEIKEEYGDSSEVTIDEKDFSVLKKLGEEYDDFFAESEPSQFKRSSVEDQYKTYLESSIQAEISLYDHVLKEAADSFNDPEDLEAAKILIGYMDESGFIGTPIKEVALLHNLREDRLLKVLTEIQTFDPYGIGAISIQESLLIQLRCLKKQDTIAYAIVERHYNNLLNNKIPAIQKDLKCSFEKILEVIECDIASLDLHPGMHYSLRKSQNLVADVSLREEDGRLIVEVNRECTPNLRLNRKYLEMLEDPEVPSETKSFLRRHVFSAKWLVRNLQQRYSTIERIALSLVERQSEFFASPEGKLLPLTMKALAEELSLHESTIARTVSNKYIDTPRGLLPLRGFFTTEYVSDEGVPLSSNTILESILEAIKNEDKRLPLSDEKISMILKERGMTCARRTVAKHRASLGLGSALQRKKF
jgi:RNA polymerase sigma-54 factor